MVFKNRDEEKKKHLKISETDFIWDIDDITPPANPGSVYGGEKSRRDSFSSADKTEMTLIENVSVQDISAPSKIKAETERISRDNYVPECCAKYKPENEFIDSVEVYTWHSKYTFYERFRIDADRYFDMTQDEVPFVKYFSYMPSYIQMSIAQKKWYFYWRSKVRQGEYLPTDSSYILLYIYEIINLPERYSANEGLEKLCEIWRAYRKSYTKLDKYMSEWLCDYCLINRLDVPVSLIGNIIFEVKEASSFKQFYMKNYGCSVYASLLLEMQNGYKWYKSKYITKENAKIFYHHIPRSFEYAIRKFSEFDGRFDFNKLESKKTVRDAYSGSLCAYNVKRRIDIVYKVLSQYANTEFIVTDTVRYCENKIRAYLGIRPRLAIQNLTQQQKNIIDEYFDLYLPSANFAKKAEKVENDEYTPRPFCVSADVARSIEKASWALTDRLTENTDENCEYSNQSKYENDTPYENLYESDNAEHGLNDVLLKEKNGTNEPTEISIEGETLNIAKEALLCIYKGDKEGFSRLASDTYMLEETLVECVNELCYELFGDIGVEEKDGKYTVIPDYEQEIRQWLNL